MILAGLLKPPLSTVREKVRGLPKDNSVYKAIDPIGFRSGPKWWTA